jgi:hypothetical protein
MIRRSIVSIPAKATTRRQARPAPADDHGPVRTKRFSAGAPDSGNPFWRVFLAYSPQWLYETDFRSFPGMLGFDKTRSARSGRLPTLDNPTAGSSRFSPAPSIPRARVRVLQDPLSSLVYCFAITGSFRARPIDQGKAQSAGNGQPFARTATPNWSIGRAPEGRVSERPSALLRPLEADWLPRRGRA